MALKWQMAYSNTIFCPKQSNTDTIDTSVKT